MCVSLLVYSGVYRFTTAYILFYICGQHTNRTNPIWNFFYVLFTQPYIAKLICWNTQIENKFIKHIFLCIYHAWIYVQVVIWISATLIHVYMRLFAFEEVHGFNWKIFFICLFVFFYLTYAKSPCVCIYLCVYIRYVQVNAIIFNRLIFVSY